METDSKIEPTKVADTIDTTKQTVPENNADTGKNKGEEDKTVQMKQSEFTAKMAERAGQAKRNAERELLEILGVSDVTAGKAIVKAHEQAEEKRKKDEEAAKSELQRATDALTVSTDELTALKTTTGGTVKKLLIEAAIMRRAPEKDVPAALFDDLLTLMDTSTISVTDGVVSDDEVDKAIDKTLEGRDHMKVAPANAGRGNGSPSRRSTPPKTPGTPEPVKRNRNASM